MRALVMEGFGEPTQAKPGELPKPDIGPGDLLVRIGAASLNPVDWKEVAGFLAAFFGPYTPQWAPGLDGAGVVEAVGRDVMQFAPGDHVVVRPERPSGNGTLAEYVKVPQDRASKAPKGLSHAETASLATAGRTAFQSLFRPDMGALKAGQAVLVEGAAGGVGSFVVGFAHAAGLKVAATCRHENADYVRGLGADLIIDYKQQDAVNETRRWMPGGVDVVVDCHSGGHKTELLDALKPGGRLIVVVTLTQDADFPQLIGAAQKQGLSVMPMAMDHATMQKDIAEMAPLIESGRMRMPEVKAYPLARAAEALQAVKNGGIRGKIAVEI